MGRLTGKLITVPDPFKYGCLLSGFFLLWLWCGFRLRREMQYIRGSHVSLLVRLIRSGAHRCATTGASRLLLFRFSPSAFPVNLGFDRSQMFDIGGGARPPSPAGAAYVR